MLERQSDGDSLQTGPVASVAMARTRRRPKAGLIPIFAAAAFVLGAGAVSVPEAPTRVDLDVMSGSEIAIAFSAPLSDGGSAVQSYEVSACWCRLLGGRRVRASEQDLKSLVSCE